MTRGLPELVATARLVEDYAVVYQSAIVVLDEQWLALDWHGSSSGGDGTPHGIAESSPVEVALDRKLALEADYAQLDDDRRTLAAMVHSMLSTARTIAARYPPERHEVVRCSGKIDPTCQEAASDHHDPNTGSVIAGICDACWLIACPGCYLRAGDTRRKITVNGRAVPGCEACYRTEVRRAARIIGRSA